MSLGIVKHYFKYYSLEFSIALIITCAFFCKKAIDVAIHKGSPPTSIDTIDTILLSLMSGFFFHFSFNRIPDLISLYRTRFEISDLMHTISAGGMEILEFIKAMHGIPEDKTPTFNELMLMSQNMNLNYPLVQVNGPDKYSLIEYCIFISKYTKERLDIALTTNTHDKAQMNIIIKRMRTSDFIIALPAIYGDLCDKIPNNLAIKNPSTGEKIAWFVVASYSLHLANKQFRNLMGLRQDIPSGTIIKRSDYVI